MHAGNTERIQQVVFILFNVYVTTMVKKEEVMNLEEADIGEIR